MNATTVAGLYYDAWRDRAGDMTGVPLAENFTFTGPVASFEDAAGFRAMARDAGAALRSFRVRRQFSDGDLVCSIIDWEMAMLPGVLTAAEVLEVRDGTIVRAELIYDAEPLRQAMAKPSVITLLERCVGDTADVFNRVDLLGTAGWAAQSPCTKWTVRQAGNHLVGAISALTKIVSGEPFDPAEVDPTHIDFLGSQPGTQFRDTAARCVAALSRPGTLDRRFPLPAPDMPGLAIAHICLAESLIHGWDIATGAGVAYEPDDAVVTAVRDWAFAAIGDAQRGDNFEPALPVPAGATPLSATLRHLGREG